ncbi:MAG: hypothetical protein R3E88_08850 [Myxococcota bacterium]|nr:hypothetical protein [Myxococcales bacterium]
MPIEKVFHCDGRLAITRCSGAVTTDDLVVLRDHPRAPSPDGYVELVDCRAVVTIPVSPEAIRRFVHQMRGRRDLAARAAILAPSALGFGMARMFDSLASLAQWPGEVRVFRSGEGLAEWLFGDEDCRMAGELATAVAGEAPVTLR